MGGAELRVSSWLLQRVPRHALHANGVELRCSVVSASADAGPEAGPSTPTQGTTVKTEMPSAGTKMDPVDCDDLRGDRYGKPHILDFDSL